MTHDLIIIGGGPAAVGAGVYAARKKLNTVMVADEFSGQSVVSEEIYNWIGTRAISGIDLAKQLADHVKSYASDTFVIKEGELAQRVDKASDDTYKVTTESGATYTSKVVIIATGARRRKLPVEGADVFEHKGLTYCATCDGPLFTGKEVVVIGGGNAGFESAAQLLAYAKHVTLLENNTFKADPVTVEKVLANEHMSAYDQIEVQEIYGDTMVKGVRYKDKKTGEIHTLPAEGVFVEIGVMPNTELVANLVTLDEYGHIIVDCRTQQTSQKGVWAAGDCTNGLYAQNNIAVGDAIKAVEDVYVYLKA